MHVKMMKKFKLLCPVTGVIHVGFLHMLVPIQTTKMTVSHNSCSPSELHREASMCFPP